MKYRTGKSCSYHHQDNCWELPSQLIISPPLGWAALICDWDELPLPLLQAVPRCHQRVMSRCPGHDILRRHGIRTGDRVIIRMKTNTLKTNEPARRGETTRGTPLVVAISKPATDDGDAHLDFAVVVVPVKDEWLGLI